MRRVLFRAALAVSVAVLAAACSGKSKQAAPAKTSTSSSSSTTPVVAPGTAPLTGLPIDPATASRPALIVKIDNAPRARPQSGINQADVVVEEMVEGGITRLACVFQSTNAVVGPVRSARSTDIAFASALNHPLFAYSGANDVFLKLVHSAPLTDVGVDNKPAAYHREPGRPAPYNLFSTTALIYAGETGSPPPALFDYRAAGTAPAGGQPVQGVDLLFNRNVSTTVGFRWDGLGWKRVENGTPHVDAAGVQVDPPNLVVEFVNYHDTGILDRSGSAVPEGELVGTGAVWVFTDGMVVKGTWSKPSASAVTKLTDAGGRPIALTPGRTWVDLSPANGNGSATMVS